MISALASAPPADGLVCQVRAALQAEDGHEPPIKVRAMPAMGFARAAVSLGPAADSPGSASACRQWPGRQQLKGVHPELCRCASQLIAAGYQVYYAYAAGGGYIAVWPIEAEPSVPTP